MHRLATVTAALALATPALARAPYQPCAHATSVIARDLVPGAGPTGLATRPLYELELSVTGRRGFRVTGREQVSYAAPAPTPVAVLTLPAPTRLGRGSHLKVTSVAAVVGPGDPKPAHFARGRGRLTVTLPRAPRVGERVAIRLGLAGRVPPNVGGMGATLQGYIAGTAPGGTLAAEAGALTLLSPEALLVPWRHGGPWGVPEAPFGAPSPAPVACHLVTVEAPSSLMAIPSGTTVGTVPVAGGRVRHVFVAAGRRVGVVLAPRGGHRSTRDAGAVAVTAFAGGSDTASTVASEAASAVAVLGARLGPLPWRHLSLVVGPVPGPLAGMRVGGLVVVSPYVVSQANLPLPAFAGAGSGPSPLEMTVVQQVAHQWFGEVVATPGPEAPVVEELLADEAMREAIAARHGAGAVDALRHSFLAGAYTVYRSLGGADGVADRPARALGSIATWSGLCAAKAPGIWSVLADRLGEKTVARAVDGLARADRFGFVDRAHLQGALYAAAPGHIKDTRRLFAHWLDEAHGDADLGGPNGAIGALLQGMPALGSSATGGGPAAQRMQTLMRQMMKAMIRQLQSGGP